jgi:hypothetical protein
MYGRRLPIYEKIYASNDIKRKQLPHLHSHQNLPQSHPFIANDATFI